MRFTFFALAAASCATSALAAPSAVAKPVAPWERTVAGGLCRMKRSFEADGQPHLLILEQNAPGRALGIAMAGASLGTFNTQAPLRVSFSPGDAGFDKTAQFEPNSQYGHVAILHGVWLEQGAQTGESPALPRIDQQAAEGIERISVVQGDGRVTFETGPLGETAQALNQCTAQIMRGWGFDPIVQYGLQRAAAPADIPRLMAQMRNAYARTAIRTLQQGIIDIVVFTDRAGAATGCKVLVATGYDALDKKMCDTVRKERFTPALDADGRATASF